MSSGFELGANAEDYFGGPNVGAPQQHQVELPVQAGAVPAVTAAQAIARQVEQERFFNGIRRRALTRIRRHTLVHAQAGTRD